MSNLPEFAAAYGCEAGDAMVRPAAERCRIW
jgi:predicted metalloendopeptidase